MVHIASPNDRTDPDKYPDRLRMWEDKFIEAGATEVYKFPLLSFTQNDLRQCFDTSN